MNIQRVKQGARITLYNGIYMIVLGAIYIAFVKYIMKSNFQAIDSIWKLFEKYNPKLANLFLYYNVIIGIFLISLGIIIIYVSYFIYKRKDKASWVILFLSGIIGWAGLLVVSILIKNPLLITLSGIGWATFILGMVLPIKYYLEKGYREY
ncbi:MAG: hypothetical protein WC438_05115 [Candidatus Pacearchaeota archaeon]